MPLESKEEGGHKKYSIKSFANVFEASLKHLVRYFARSKRTNSAGF